LTVPETLSCTSVGGGPHTAGSATQNAAPESLHIRQPAEVCELCRSTICCEEPHLHYANHGCSEHLRAEAALKNAIDTCDSKAIARYCAASPNVETSSGKTALAVAVEMGDRDLIARLVQVGGVDPLVRLTVNMSSRSKVAQQKAIEMKTFRELEDVRAELRVRKVELDATKATTDEFVQQSTAERDRLRKELSLTRKELEMLRARFDSMKRETAQEMHAQTQKELGATKATLEATKNALELALAQLFSARAEKSQSFLEKKSSRS